MPLFFYNNGNNNNARPATTAHHFNHNSWMKNGQIDMIQCRVLPGYSAFSSGCFILQYNMGDIVASLPRSSSDSHFNIFLRLLSWPVTPSPTDWGHAGMNPWNSLDLCSWLKWSKSILILYQTTLSFNDPEIESFWKDCWKRKWVLVNSIISLSQVCQSPCFFFFFSLENNLISVVFMQFGEFWLAEKLFS